MKNEAIPAPMNDFRREYSEVWGAFERLADTCHDRGGPLDEKSRRLVKLGIAIGFRHEGAVHSAVRHAIRAGITREELIHTALLAVTTIGWPAAYAAVTWIEDVFARGATQFESPPSAER